MARAVFAQAVLATTLMIASAHTGSPATLDGPSPQVALELSPGREFIETDGASLYANICQGCHMRDGRGAIGAASYPSLVANAHLQSAAFVVEVVLKGLKGMPPVGRSMTDDQVAAIVNYLRSHFGNAFDDAVTTADVKAQRN